MAHASYLTYAEYQSYGGTLSQSAFTPLEFKARKRIDYVTDSRVQDMQTVPDAVKLCAFGLINLEQSVGVEKQVTNPVVTSFSTDGYSENYGNVLSIEQADKEMNKLVRTYLYGENNDEGIPLLYRGVNA